MPEEALKLIYLSPHLDDVALSCGGLVWEQAQAGMAVEVWSVCAGDPPPGELSEYARSLHARWD
ncbi:MAG: PIG-L family deacetylase, partial [Anaerolineales bacterium]|nr:PIG-L family deacetylase [Anaerolineales bacterium]